MKRRIRISESQYNNLFVSSLLFEAKRLRDILSIGAFSDISDDMLFKIAGLDPTYDGGEYAGKYTLWLVDQYKKGVDVFGIDGLRDAISKFNSNKSKLSKSKITQYDADGLVSAMNGIYDGDSLESGGSVGLCTGLPSVSQIFSKSLSSRVVTLYDDGKITARCPFSWEASRKIGGSTRWCTASSDKLYFIEYMMKGELLIIYSKRINGGKSEVPLFQEAYCNGSCVEFRNYDNSEATNHEFRPQMGFDYDFIPNDLKDRARSLMISYRDELLARYYSEIDINSENLERSCYFGESSGSRSKFILIEDTLYDKYNIFDYNAKSFVFDTWFDSVGRYNFMDGENFTVKKGGKYNIVGLVDGSLNFLYEQWFDSINISDRLGFAELRIDDKYSVCSLSGMSNWGGNWYDSISVYSQSRSRIRKNVLLKGVFINAGIGDKFILVDTNSRPLDNEYRSYIISSIDALGNKLIMQKNDDLEITYNMILNGEDSFFFDDEITGSIDMFSTKKSSAVFVKYDINESYGEVFLINDKGIRMFYPGAIKVCQYGHWIFVRDNETHMWSIYNIDTGMEFPNAGKFNMVYLRPRSGSDIGVALMKGNQRFIMLDDYISLDNNSDW